MSFKQLNPGPLAGFRGGEMIAFGFRIDGTNDPDFLWQGGSNSVVSVVRTSEGLFTVQLNRPYPRQLIYGDAALHLAADDVSDNDAYVVRDSYDNSAGTLQIVVKEDGGGDGAGEVSDPEDNDVITFFGIFQTLDALVEDQS